MPHQQKRLIFFSRSQALRLLGPGRLGTLGFHKERLVLEDPQGARPLSTPPPPPPPTGGGVYILFLGLVCSWGRVREGDTKGSSNTPDDPQGGRRILNKMVNFAHFFAFFTIFDHKKCLLLVW